MAIDFNLLAQNLPGARNSSTLQYAMQARSNQQNALQAAIADQQRQQQQMANYAANSKALASKEQLAREAIESQDRRASENVQLQRDQLAERQRQFDIKLDLSKEALGNKNAKEEAAKARNDEFNRAFMSGNRAMMYALNPEKAMEIEESQQKKLKENVKTEQSLRKEFMDNVAPFEKASNAYARINQIRKVITDPNTKHKGAGDVALVYSMAKMYDEGGRVTDGDFNTIAAVKTIPSVIKIMAKKLDDGDQLTDLERNSLLQMADSIFTAAKSGYSAKEEQFRKIAEDANLNPYRVTPNALNPEALKAPSNPTADRRAELEARRQQLLGK